MVKATVVLFDLDGTLVDTGGAGGRAMRAAIAEVAGCCGSADFAFNGLTDPIIVRRGLQSSGLAEDEDAVERVLERYLERLPRELACTQDYRVLPGVMDLLGLLQNCTEAAVGLGTGNLHRGAVLKLTPASLNEYFSFGGFASDAEERAELIRIGAARGAARLGVCADSVRVVVVGDTPLDVAAGKINGARCIAVATGGHPMDALRDAGADYTFATLADEGVLAAIL